MAEPESPLGEGIPGPATPEALRAEFEHIFPGAPPQDITRAVWAARGLAAVAAEAAARAAASQRGRR
jgi:hypothetical protein